MPAARRTSTETYSSRLKASKAGTSSSKNPRHALHIAKAASTEKEKEKAKYADVSAAASAAEDGPSTDLAVIYQRLKKLALPYFMEGPQVKEARVKLATVVLLTLATTGVSVLFSFLGRDFFNALSAKDQEKFSEMLLKWLGALVVGIPVFVMRDYYQSKVRCDDCPRG